MYLTDDEEKALNGEYGEGLEIVYRILVSIGRLTDASRLIPIASAHVSGVSYLTIGEYGAEFLEEFSKDLKVSVYTTINPCSIDTENWSRHGIDEDFAEKQFKIIEAYRRMGVKDSFTCVPYEGYNLPPPNSHVSWAESSAAIYANSILGLKTNRESALSAMAAAVAGKTPYSDLHLEENRRPGIVVNIKTSRSLDTVGFGLLGYFAGRLTSRPIGFKGLLSLEKKNAKALSAAVGTSGSSGMFILNPDVKDVETVDFTDRELKETYWELNDEEKGDAVVLGCPQLTLDEVGEIAAKMKDRRFKKRCLIFCSKNVYSRAEKLGYTNTIEEAGGEFIRDACADFTPLIKVLDIDSVETDTCKAAHYIKRVHNVKICLKDTAKILEECSR